LTGLNSFTVDVVIVAVLKILRRNVASCVYVEIAAFRNFYESVRVNNNETPGVRV